MRVRVEIVDGDVAMAAEVEDYDRSYTPEVITDWLRLAREVVEHEYATLTVTQRLEARRAEEAGD